MPALMRQRHVIIYYRAFAIAATLIYADASLLRRPALPPFFITL